jgi:microsomal dipeptidase-like Zn-dependent dipeptidase
LALGTDFDGASMPSCLPDVSTLYRLADYLLSKNTEESFVNGLFFDHAADFFNKL